MDTSKINNAIVDAINDYFSNLYAFLDMIIRRFCKNLYHSFADMTMHRWTKVGLSVLGYILIRPYIEAFFKKMHDRDRKKQQEKERAEAKARGKAKVSANTLRGDAAAGDGEGKVLGEVENTDDEIEGEDAEEFATASGVPEWGKNARKRAKKHQKKLEKEAAEAKGSKLSEDQLMELLDWSDSEDDKKA
ncbi:trafficking PGA2-domain-containing protein [Aspergillus pseudoustus]|uniref:Trafficking PGA2-domain-containing protein n=1 Tax=Aspergillus pseudoustus TaxID=1810923 RepID=A0ABR4JJI2_9EURO